MAADAAAVPFALVSAAWTEEDDEEAAAPAPAATPAAAPAATQTAASATIPAAESTRPTHVGDIELVERGAAPARGTGTASVSFQLAQETCRQLEMRGDYTLAAEVLARALAQEGLRINHHLLPSATDLVSEPERCAVISKSLVVAMAHMQEDLRSLKAPLLQREPPPLQRLLDAVEREAQRVRCLPDAWLGALRPANELPRPARALELLARRWQLPTALVGGYWTDFTAASGGLYTLSLARAKLTLLSELPDATLQQATWALLLLDPASAELIERDENGAEPSGAGGASFEEYLIFRRFAEAPTLEQQFRFLWRLYDRDGDGLLGWADLLAALQLQRWRHGWSEAYTYQWAEYVWGVVARRDRTTEYVCQQREGVLLGGATAHGSGRRALGGWGELSGLWAAPRTNGTRRCTAQGLIEVCGEAARPGRSRRLRNCPHPGGRHHGRRVACRAAQLGGASAAVAGAPAQPRPRQGRAQRWLAPLTPRLLPQGHRRPVAARRAATRAARGGGPSARPPRRQPDGGRAEL